MATTSMNIRINNDIKKQAEDLFAEFGINMTTAVNMFLRQAIREQSIPFGLTLKPSQAKKHIETLNKQNLDDDKKLRTKYIKQLNNAIAQSMDEELIHIPRSKKMREPVIFID